MSEQDASQPDESAQTEQDRQDDSVDGIDDAGASTDEAEAPSDVAAETDPEGGAELNDDLVERIEETDPEQLAGEVVSLRERVDSLESQLESREEEVEDLESKLARKKADFQNYKKRMKKRREEERQRATEDLVERLVDVRDNLVRALDQGEDADIRDGVEATLRQFDEELERENVETIEPVPGEEVDPQRHEVLLRVESDHPEGTVADLHRPGYEMAGKVVRAAQITVSEGGNEDGAGGNEGNDNDAADATGEGEADDE